MILNIGGKIQLCMKEKGISQSELVRRTGISKGAISSYISGRYNPKLTSIVKIAEALDVPPLSLIEIEKETADD